MVSSPPILLKIVSFNLAECRPSAQAPRFWTADHSTNAIYEELLRHQADVLALQECPDELWAQQIPGYKLMGTKMAHAGNVALLLRSELADKAVACSLRHDLPIVAAKIQLSLDTSILVASCHLAPLDGRDRVRSFQVEDFLNATQSKTTSLVVLAGDTNMRQHEDQTMEESFGLVDVWKQAGCNPLTQYTWDTRDHRPKGGLFRRLLSDGQNEDKYFNRFYGKLTREYAARYDRIYLSLPKRRQAIVNVAIESFALVANKPQRKGKSTYFLSDHFGVCSTISMSMI